MIETVTKLSQPTCQWLSSLSWNHDRFHLQPRSETWHFAGRLDSTHLPQCKLRLLDPVETGTELAEDRSHQMQPQAGLQVSVDDCSYIEFMANTPFKNIVLGKYLNLKYPLRSNIDLYILYIYIFF